MGRERTFELWGERIIERCDAPPIFTWEYIDHVADLPHAIDVAIAEGQDRIYEMRDRSGLNKSPFTIVEGQLVDSTSEVE